MKKNIPNFIQIEICYRLSGRTTDLFKLTFLVGKWKCERESITAGSSYSRVELVQQIVILCISLFLQHFSLCACCKLKLCNATHIPLTLPSYWWWCWSQSVHNARRNHHISNCINQKMLAQRRKCNNCYKYVIAMKNEQKVVHIFSCATFFTVKSIKRKLHKNQRYFSSTYARSHTQHSSMWINREYLHCIRNVKHSVMMWCGVVCKVEHVHCTRVLMCGMWNNGTNVHFNTFLNDFFRMWWNEDNKRNVWRINAISSDDDNNVWYTVFNANPCKIHVNLHLSE